MATTIPSLWPEDIKVDILPPVTILRAQAGKLGELTQGILDAEVTTVTGEQDFVVHRLDLIAPALSGRRYRALTAAHRADHYPVVLEADCFRPPEPVGFVNIGKVLTSVMRDAEIRSYPWPHKGDWKPVAADQDEFLKRVGEVLRSMEVRSMIVSMIARSNQKEEESDDSATPAA